MWPSASAIGAKVCRRRVPLHPRRAVGASALTRLSDSLQPVAQFLPFHVFDSLTNYRQYDPELYRRAVERATEAGRTPPEIWNMRVLLGAALGWIARLVIGSFVSFRKRDL